MSQSSSNSKQQPESSQPGIIQDLNGNLVGNFQTANGNHINQSIDNRTTNNFYLNLQDEDLEPLSLSGKIISYFKVFIFLVITLIFWTFFGIFTSFPFPYGQAIDLIFCCFKGTVASKVNRLQKRVQSENIDSRSIEKLNNLDFQVHLHLGVLKNLGTNKADSHERLAKTIESLKQKKNELQKEIKPHQPQKYKIVTRIHDFLELITLSHAERDLIQIESILNEIIEDIRNNHPSETIVQDTINSLSTEISQRADQISPFRIGVLYRIEALLREVSAKEISSLEEPELNKIISELKERKDDLSKELSRLYDERKLAQQELRDSLEERDRLNSRLDERKSELSKLHEKLRGYAEANESKQIEINALNLELTRVNEKLQKIQVQKSSFGEQINCLKQDIRQQQTHIEQLTDQLNQYSQIRTLKGKYIGNLSEPKSKYHFNQKCNHWKMLVGEYVLKLDVSREIASSNTSTLFTKAGLEDCDICAGRKTQNNRA